MGEKNGSGLLKLRGQGIIRKGRRYQHGYLSVIPTMTSTIRRVYHVLLIAIFLAAGWFTQAQGAWETGFFLEGNLPQHVVAAPGFTQQLSDLKLYNQLGGGLGFAAWRRLYNWLALRTGVGLYYQDSQLYYAWSDGEAHRESLAALTASLPLLIEVQNNRLPLRPVFFGGLVYNYHHLTGTEIRRLNYAAHEMAAQFGLGLNIDGAPFVFRPEVYFQLGLTNRMGDDVTNRYQYETQRLLRDLIGVRIMAKLGR